MISNDDFLNEEMLDYDVINPATARSAYPVLYIELSHIELQHKSNIDHLRITCFC